MANAEINEVVNVDFAKIYQVVSRYEEYPQFLDGCKSARVERKGAGRARVAYHVSMIKDVLYVLDHEENVDADAGTGTVEWKLVESDTFKMNSGKWALKSLGPGKTEVNYSLEVEFKIPVPGLIL